MRTKTAFGSRLSALGASSSRRGCPIAAARKPKAESRKPSRDQGTSRGVALILVLTTLAILTAVGVDFSFSSRVDLRLAENLRDDTRAHYLARSAINLSRLLLHFQKQIDGLGGQLSGALQALQPQISKTLGGSTTPPPPGAQPGAPAPAVPQPGQQQQGGLGIRLWEIVPVDSNLLGSVLAGGGAADLVPQDKRTDRDRERIEERRERREHDAPIGMHAFGAFEGSYTAKITDENTRINVVGLAGLSAQQLPAYLQLRALMQDPKFDFIFDEEDANRDRVRREDVIVALKDWIDEDEQGSALDPLNPRAPFANGFSDENQAYDRYNPRYKAKNDRPDSLDELYMVRGVNDRWMAAFGDRVTIWLDKNARININSSDHLQMVSNVIAAAANPNDPRLLDARLIATILQELQLRRMVSFFGLSVSDFISTLEANGVTVRPELKDPRNPNQFFGDTSDTFRIVATGRAGRIEKKITAVVRYDDLLGKLLYWKED
jgi:general secretion pathway protein K